MDTIQEREYTLHAFQLSRVAADKEPPEHDALLPHKYESLSDRYAMQSGTEMIDEGLPAARTRRVFAYRPHISCTFESPMPNRERQ